MAMQPGPWEDFQQPARPVAPQPIIPRTAAPRQPEETRRDVVATRRTEALLPSETSRAAAEAAKAAVEAQAAVENARRAAQTRASLPEVQRDLLRVIENARRAQQLSRDGWFATGFGHSWLGRTGGSAPGGSSAANLDATLDQIGSNTAFDRLSRMRAESPTGGALGNVTERELNLLQSTIASPSVAQSDEEFQRSMDDIINAYSGIYTRLGGRMEDVGGPQAAGASIIGTGADILRDEGPPASVTPPRGGNPGGPVEQIQSFAEPQLTRGPGLPPLTPGEAVRNAGREELGQGDQVRLNADRDELHARQTLALARSGASIEDLNALQRQQGRGPLSPEVVRLIRAHRGDPSRIPAFAPNYQMGPDPLNAVRAVLPMQADEGLTDFTVGALDSASLGLPGLVSEDHRRRVSDSRSRSPVSSTIGSIVGGVLAPGGPRPGMSLGAQTLRTGGQGTIYGFSSTGGDPAAALVGGTIGAAAPGAFNIVGRGGRGAFNFVRGGDGVPNPAAVAARELEIPLMPGDVGGPATRRLTAFGAQLPFSTNRITNAYEATNTAGQAARNRVAQTVAGEGQEVLGMEAGGEAARRGALSYRASSRDQVGRAYDRAEELAGDTRITPANAIQVLDRNIAELGEVPGGAPSALTTLRGQLDGDFTVSGLRNLRTRLRDDFGSQGLRGSDVERRAMQVVDALSDDINGGLTRAGRSEAAVAYRAADALHRERIDMLDSVIMPIIGRTGTEKSGEQIVQGLNRAAAGNSQRLERFIGSLPAEEARSVRATLIGRMGQAVDSQQNAATDAFSLDTFLTHYSAMQPSARRTVFGRAGQRALDQLAEVAGARREAGRFANRSNTGSIVGGVATGGSVAGGLPAIVLTAAAQYGMGRVLTSPKLVRFLANMPSDPARARPYIDRLTRMARVERNPAMAQEILGLRSALLNAANDNSLTITRAAASDGTDPNGE